MAQTYDNPGALAGATGAGISSQHRRGGYTTQELETATAAAWGGSPPRRMRLVSFKALSKGALRGFACIELPNRLQIDDCAVCVSNGRAWASLPSKPQLDRDGCQVVKDGKKQFAAMLRWPDRDTADRWSNAVVELVRAEHPEALR
jgi:hypothetical protein